MELWTQDQLTRTNPKMDFTLREDHEILQLRQGFTTNLLLPGPDPTGFGPGFVSPHLTVHNSVQNIFIA
jgi:hypothetical protein